MPDLEVLEQIPWEVHWGGCNNKQGGIEGMLSKCRVGELVFYVRENIRAHGGSFMMSSGERISWKRGKPSKRHLQVLELVVPPGVDWDRIAAIVHEADGLKRKVETNARFSITWARRAMGGSARQSMLF